MNDKYINEFHKALGKHIDYIEGAYSPTMSEISDWRKFFEDWLSKTLKEVREASYKEMGEYLGMSEMQIENITKELLLGK